MGASLLMLANEGFAASPVSLRARFEIENGYKRITLGHYGCEICPGTEEGIAEIMRERREVLSRFSDLRIDYAALWPYDQGGCTCAGCVPWGAR